MKNTRKPNRRAFTFEGLENRSMMAGNITAAVIGGTLTLTGDATHNSVLVQQSGNKWTVQGLGTTINGTTTIKSFTGVQGLLADLKTGNDVIRVSNGTL